MAQSEPEFKVLLRRWRERKGLLQKQACSLLGVDLDLYRKWEVGINEPHSTPSKTEILKRIEEQP